MQKFQLLRDLISTSIGRNQNPEVFLKFFFFLHFHNLIFEMLDPNTCIGVFFEKKRQKNTEGIVRKKNAVKLNN